MPFTNCGHAREDHADIESTGETRCWVLVSADEPAFDDGRDAGARLCHCLHYSEGREDVQALREIGVL